MASVESKSNTFPRLLDIEVLSQEIILHQKIEGDVSCVVWDAAIVLGKYLEELYKKDRDFIRGSNVIELGSGLGLVGLVAACLGANVLLTDLTGALPLLQFNIAENRALYKGLVSSTVLNWGENVDLGFIPDKILFADCVYYKESIDSLIKTLRYYTSQKTEIILAQELRDTGEQSENWEYFLEKVKRHFYCIEVPLSEQNLNYSSPDIVILKLYIKQNC